MVQAGAAAPIAWFVAHRVLGHPQPIFAPISALVAIGVTVGFAWQRAVEIVLGVAIGVGVADALAEVLGRGSLQIGIMVVLAMAVAIVVGGRAVFVQQAAVSAVLVAALPSAGGLASIDRFVDTLVGGTAALLLTLVLLPVRPLRLVRRATEPTVVELAGTFNDIARGMRTRDCDVAAAALLRARATGDLWASLNVALDVGQQAARVAPTRRREQEVLLDLATCVEQLDYTIRNARVMARVALRLVETDGVRSPDLAPAVDSLATAAHELGRYVDGDLDAAARVRVAAEAAAYASARTAPAELDLLITHLTGQIRSTAVDYFRATGLPREEALALMLDAVGRGRAAAASTGERS